MDSIDVSSDATVRIKLSNELCVVTFAGEGSECRVCAYSGHAICNGDWSWPALPSECVSTESLAERSAESIKENASHVSRSKSDTSATISPRPGDEVDGDMGISKVLRIPLMSSFGECPTIVMHCFFVEEDMYLISKWILRKPIRNTNFLGVPMGS
jgi:hypothetical protein